MVTFEQIKLRETKVAKALDHINKVTEENSLLKGKLETYRKRVDELEGLVKRFKDDQSRIEEGILAALDRLNQFEDAVGKSLPSTPPAGSTEVPPVPVPMEGAASPGEQPPVPGMYLEEENELSDEEIQDETPEDRSAGELDIF
jgi:hypothetical protein